jgi:hypothetical protein
MERTDTSRLRSRTRKTHREARAHEEEPVSLEDKLRSRCGPGAVKFVARVSSTLQEDNRGSILSQLGRSKRYMQNLGIDVSGATDELWVESAKGKIDRVQFEKFIVELSQKATRVVGVGYGNRLTRNSRDGVRLLDTASEVAAMFVVGERIYDPREPDHRAELMAQFVEAERENSKRAIHSADSRDELARNMAYRRILPTGLCWVAATDPNYEAMAEAAGLGTDLLAHDRLASHKTEVKKNGVYWYVLFDPHQDVHTALDLILSWFFETESISAVARRIAEDPAYPRPGMVPVARANTFNPAIPPHWKKPARGWLQGWLKSEAVYGMYSFCSLAGMREYGKQGLDILVPDAFPAFLTHSDLDRVNRILSSLPRPLKRGAYRGPRNHALALLRCANRLPNGEPCGRSMGAFYDGETGRHKYVCGDCQLIWKGERAKVHAHVDGFVLEVLRRVFAPDSMDGFKATVSTETAEHEKRARALEERALRLGSQIGSALDLQADARSAGKNDRVRMWERRLNSYEEQRRGLEEAIRTHERQGRQLRALSEPALSELRSLTGDLERLMAAARAAEVAGTGEGLVRGIVRALTNSVHVRVLVPTLYEVSVEFPSGEQVTGYVSTTKTRPTAQERAYIEEALRDGVSPTLTAKRLTRYRELAPSHYQSGSRRGPWTADAVVAVDMVFPKLKQRKRRGEHASVKELAERVLESEERVIGAILAGSLGPAKVECTHIAACPTEAEIEAAFPASIARRRAAASGWPLDQLITVADLVVETGVRRSTVLRVARSLDNAFNTAERTPILHRGRMLKALESRRMNPTLHVPAGMRHLPQAHWKTRPQLLRELPSKAAREVCARAPRFSHAPADVYFNVSPEVVREVLAGDMPETLERMRYGHLSPDDFMSQKQLLEFLKSRYGVGSHGSLRTAVRRGTVTKVTAKRPGQGSTFYWVPQEVRNGRNSSVVWEWFGGAFLPSQVD